MKRNVVQQGKTSLLISLPIKWARKYNIKKGDELNLDINQNKIKISTINSIRSNKTQITIDDDNYVYIWRILSHAYMSGYDEIKITYSSTEVLNWINKYLTEFLIGFEIIEQQNTYCIIKQISNENTEEFNSMIRRVYLISMQASQIILDYFQSQTNPSLIINLEKTNNRQTTYLKRSLIKQGYEKQKKTIYINNIITLHEELLNEFKFLTWEIQKNKNFKFSNKSKKFYQEIHQSLDLTYQLFYKYDQNLIKTIWTKLPGPENAIKLVEKDPFLTIRFEKILGIIRKISFNTIGFYN